MLRRLILIFTIVDVVLLVVRSARYGFPGFGWNHAWDLFALIAEYAKTIRTIPPRRRSEGFKAGDLARSTTSRTR